jgi:Methylamine utilisation protein MauE
VPYVLVACRALLLVVFATSAFGKVRGRPAWSGFLQSVRDLRLVPARWVDAVAVTVVGGEAAVVLLLAVPATAAVGFALAGALFATFTVAIIVTLRRGVTAARRCFGSTALPLGRRHELRNGLLLTVAALGALSRSAPPSSPHPSGLVVAVASGLIGAAFLMFFDEIVELFAPAAHPGSLEKGQA